MMTLQCVSFRSAASWHAIQTCLRAIESSNQLGNCFIWDIAIEEDAALCQSGNVENFNYRLPIPMSERKITDFFSR